MAGRIPGHERALRHGRRAEEGQDPGAAPRRRRPGPLPRLRAPLVQLLTAGADGARRPVLARPQGVIEPLVAAAAGPLIVAPHRRRPCSACPSSPCSAGIGYLLFAKTGQPARGHPQRGLHAC
ncbi:MAG: hypothetical protein MZU84_01725 [Sphingobacterium sp.]|nr:hypothetical protein [Sphingobacterium sp.]